MMHKILLTASLGSMLLLSTPVIEGQQAQGQQGPSQQATKSVTGKVSGIGDQGHSFTVDVNGGGAAAQSMKFVVDKNTQVQGQVKVGTPVMVDYQAMDGGQNLCVRVAAQQG
jgi:hypothetical protein